MAVCPNGHDSASEDFCDVCGMRIAASPGNPSAAAPSSAPGLPATGLPGTGAFPTGAMPASGPITGPPGTPAGTAEPCPRCGTAKSGQFCESCGFNFAAPTAPTSPTTPTTPPAPSSPPTGAQLPPAAQAPAPDVHVTWTAVVAADRAYYDQVRTASGTEGEAIDFPAYYAERRFRLAGTQMRIGRRSVSRGLEPEIDLTGPPVDPGISRLHAVLIAALDGGWAVLDPGSANGTLVNGTEVRVGDQVPLHDGDRINLGAWTAITLYQG
jgi:FHA domain-containing protein